MLRESKYVFGCGLRGVGADVVAVIEVLGVAKVVTARMGLAAGARALSEAFIVIDGR